MPRRRISDDLEDYSFAVTVEGPADDVCVAAADVGSIAVEDAITDEPDDAEDGGDE
jgi:hypothetical protein